MLIGFLPNAPIPQTVDPEFSIPAFHIVVCHLADCHYVDVCEELETSHVLNDVRMILLVNFGCPVNTCDITACKSCRRHWRTVYTVHIYQISSNSNVTVSKMLMDQGLSFWQKRSLSAIVCQ